MQPAAAEIRGNDSSNPPILGAGRKRLGTTSKIEKGAYGQVIAIYKKRGRRGIDPSEDYQKKSTGTPRFPLRP
jgi:hypothetical protein